MNRQVSPFAALTGAEQQIKWLEYQSVRLPYVEMNEPMEKQFSLQKDEKTSERVNLQATEYERPQPPPEVPRVINEFQKTRHSQYDAVIARLKQAELQSRRYSSLQATK